MSRVFTFVLLAGAVAFVLYLAATGVTLTDARNWFERQTGVRMGTSDLKSVPYPAYGPVIVPAK